MPDDMIVALQITIYGNDRNLSKAMTILSQYKNRYMITKQDGNIVMDRRIAENETAMEICHEASKYMDECGAELEGARIELVIAMKTVKV